MSSPASQEADLLLVLHLMSHASLFLIGKFSISDAAGMTVAEIVGERESKREVWGNAGCLGCG